MILLYKIIIYLNIGGILLVNINLYIINIINIKILKIISNKYYQELILLYN